MKTEDYNKNWKWLSKQIRSRAKNKCELCDAINKEKHWKTGSKVVLTVHHINCNKKNDEEYNLIALCQRCHLRLDLNRHIKNRKKNNNKHKKGELIK